MINGICSGLASASCLQCHNTSDYTSYCRVYRPKFGAGNVWNNESINKIRIIIVFVLVVFLRIKGFNAGSMKGKSYHSISDHTNRECGQPTKENLQDLNLFQVWFLDLFELMKHEAPIPSSVLE